MLPARILLVEDDKPFSLATFSACVAELLAHPDEIIEIATGEWQAPERGG